VPPPQLRVTTPVVINAPGAPTGGYVIAPYGKQEKPRPTDTQAHHGVNTALAKQFVYAYSESQAPTVLMTRAQHDATIAEYDSIRTEIASKTGIQSVSEFMSQLHPAQQEVLARLVAERMFTAAGTPQDVRTEYWRQFHLYRAQQEAQEKYDRWNSRLDAWKQRQAEIKMPEPNLPDP
jgi:hypothetical protein